MTWSVVGSAAIGTATFPSGGSDIKTVSATFPAGIPTADFLVASLYVIQPNALSARGWNFKNTLEGWLIQSGTSYTLKPNSVVLTIADETIPKSFYNTFSAPVPRGASCRKIRARVRRLAGTQWAGAAYYTTAGHGSSASYYKVIPDTTSGEYSILEWDMSALTAGGTDWIDNDIWGIRLDFATDNGNSFEVDWITLGIQEPTSDSVPFSFVSYIYRSDGFQQLVHNTFHFIGQPTSALVTVQVPVDILQGPTDATLIVNAFKDDLIGRIGTSFVDYQQGTGTNQFSPGGTLPILPVQENGLQVSTSYIKSKNTATPASGWTIITETNADTTYTANLFHATSISGETPTIGVNEAANWMMTSLSFKSDLPAPTNVGWLAYMKSQFAI